MNMIARVDRFLQAFYERLMWRRLYLYAAMLFLLVIIALSTPFDQVLRQDAFFYTMTGMNIAHGDFSLYRSQAGGWPFFLAFFFFLLPVDNIFQAMFVARWLSIGLVCLAVLPMAVLCRRICGEDRWRGACVVAVTAYVLSAHIRYIAQFAYTEPLFLFLTLCSCCFLVGKERPGWREFALAALFAGLSYWVRANGLFQLFVILGMVGIRSAGRIGSLVKNGLTALAVFAGVAAPHLIMRQRQFGSPFDYGPNSKYFVDRFDQVWDESVPSPSLLEYLSSHTWQDFYHKFIDNGLFRILQDLPLLLNGADLWLVLLPVAIAAAVLRGRMEMMPLVLLFGLTLAGLSIVFDVFGHVRHLIFLLPFIFISGAAFAASLSWSRLKPANIVLGLLLAYTVAVHEEIEPLPENHVQVPVVKDAWALWAADHLEGNVVLISGEDILRLAQHYRKPAAERVPQRFALVEEKIVRIRPGEHRSLAEAVESFREQGVRYVIIDDLNLSVLRRKTYLRDIREEKWRETFVPVRSFAGGEHSSALIGIEIYRFNSAQSAPTE